MLASELGIHDLGLFVLSGLLLNITPGPDSLLIMSRSAGQGWRAGAAAALGIGAGTLVHVMAGALGLSALLAASATAFVVVKLAGAAYLVWLGIGMLRTRSAGASSPVAESTAAPQGATSLWAVFRQGLLTNVLNPKVALFFLAFVPQFISADAAHKGMAFVLLGLIFDLNGMLWCLGLAAFTAGASRRIRLPASWLALLNRSIGLLFLLFGLRLALEEAR